MLLFFSYIDEKRSLYFTRFGLKHPNLLVSKQAKKKQPQSKRFQMAFQGLITMTVWTISA